MEFPFVWCDNADISLFSSSHKYLHDFDALRQSVFGRPYLIESSIPSNCISSKFKLVKQWIVPQNVSKIKWENEKKGKIKRMCPKQMSSFAFYYIFGDLFCHFATREDNKETKQERKIRNKTVQPKIDCVMTSFSTNDFIRLMTSFSTDENSY